jgi:glycosyltransferase involved in cell wall biosynthesis
MERGMNVSVIVTTYNHPKWLEKVIWGFEVQTHTDFELVIADDGSGDETRWTIDRFRHQAPRPSIHHVWHEDRGFRKCEILNKAIAEASHDYLVFVDGDCVPRRDFLETHVAHARRGRFLSGGIVRLPLQVSRQLSKEVIQQGYATDAVWLRRHGVARSRKLWLLAPNRTLGTLLDAVTTTRPTFNGHNASAWKADVTRVNGFDQRMKYGGLDRELGERLVNAGIQGKQIRHRAVCVHLDHSRGYVNTEDKQRNRAIRRHTVGSGRTWADHGLSSRSVEPDRLRRAG